MRANQPRRSGRSGQQVVVVGRFRQCRDGELERLVCRAEAEVVGNTLPGELDHLVVTAGAGGMASEVGNVRVAPLTQGVEGLLVQAAALTPEELALDGIADEFVAEAEAVVVLFHEQPPLDQRA